MVNSSQLSNMSRSKYTLFGSVFSFLTAYILCLATFILIWCKYPNYLYMYRDGEYNWWISQQTKTWSGLFDITSINPLQGMTSMLVSINPYFDPGQWIFFTSLPLGIQILCSYTIYALEMMATTFVLANTLSFSKMHGFISSIFIVLLLFPPFNFIFGLGGWIACAPILGNTLALSNIALICYLKLGKDPYRNYLSISNNIFLSLIFLLSIILILLAAPFYNAGMLFGNAILFASITFFSSTARQFYWRTCAAFIVISIFYLLGFPGFYSSAKTYSARFMDQHMFSVHLEAFKNIFNLATMKQAGRTLHAHAVFYLSSREWPLSLNTLWIHHAILIGCLLAGVYKKSYTGKIAWIVGCLWATVIIISLLLSFNILTSSFAPNLFYLPLYSLCAIYSLCIILVPIQYIFNYYQIEFPYVSFLAIFIAILLSASLIYLFRNIPIQISEIHNKKNMTEMRMLNRHTETKFIKILKEEIALEPGTIFRGMVTTIYGSPQGLLRNEIGMNNTKPIARGQFEHFLSVAAQSGNSYDLLDLWIWNIPTLSEYGQGLSKPLMFYVSKLLSSPKDVVESHFSFPHLENIEILEALGVRFMIIDKPVFHRDVSLRQAIQIKQNVMLYLYEFSNPNLGDYSPVQLISFNNIHEFYQKVNNNPGCLRTTAYVEKVVEVSLIPLKKSKLIFQKGGVHVSAKSDGASAVLLPIQFSHCYQLKNNTNSTVKMLRANIIHTLIIFNKNLDIDLIWNFRWKHSACRLEDIHDLKRLEL